VVKNVVGVVPDRLDGFVAGGGGGRRGRGGREMKMR
jgi:hypothetical protein